MSNASDAARLAAWNASDEGKAAEAAWGAAIGAAEGNARDARIAYYAARDAYLAKTTTAVTP